MGEKEKEKALAAIVSDAINDMGFNETKFAEAFRCDHRTLQQKFTRICIAWLREAAKDDYGFDDRNKATHEVAKAIIEKMDNGEIPRSLPSI